MLEWIQEAINWLWGILTNSLNALISKLTTVLPTSWQQDLTVLKDNVGYVELWFPANLAFSLLIAWCAFMLVYFTVKMVVSLIPFGVGHH
jgi:hypothetical protein